MPLWVVFAACAAPRNEPPPYAPREVVTLERWLVRSGGDVLGQVVHLEIRDPAGPIRFYRVEDGQGRWIGHATASGRFSRRVPFQDEEEDLGVWSMARGVAELFEASAPVRLEPVAVDAVGSREDAGTPR